MIRIICPGKIKDKHLAALIDDYIKRINRYHKLEVIEVKDEAINDNDSSDHIKDKEASRVLDKIDDSDYVICLDLKGKMYDSVTFAEKMDNLVMKHRRVVFVIGGSLGIGSELLERANEKIKISDMTFLHQMTRLIILEQIYRGFKILNNEVYHK